VNRSVFLGPCVISVNKYLENIDSSSASIDARKLMIVRPQVFLLGINFNLKPWV